MFLRLITIRWSSFWDWRPLLLGNWLHLSGSVTLVEGIHHGPHIWP